MGMRPPCRSVQFFGKCRRMFRVSLFCRLKAPCQLSHIEFHMAEQQAALFDLTGKVALVTGATRGIGKSIAEELGRAGAKVAICSRKADACEATRVELERAGLTVMAKPCNVSHKEDLQAFVDATRGKWGAIDIVVANAASNPYYGPLAGIPDDAFDKIF